MDRITIGPLQVVAVRDGIGHLPPAMYPGADLSGPDQLEPTGTVPIRLGGHLVLGAGDPILVDAGAGPDSMPFPPEIAAATGLTDPPEFLMETGGLLDSIKAAGVRVEDIRTILLTHLHADHVGWLMDGDVPRFPNVVVRYGAADWDALVETAEADDPVHGTMTAARAAGVLEPYARSDEEIAPGIRAIHAPGHTPGSTIIAVESAGRRLLLTGDAVQHVDQLADRDVHFAADADREAALAVRDRLFADAAESSAVLATAHLPGPVFRSVTAERGWVDAH